MRRTRYKELKDAAEAWSIRSVHWDVAAEQRQYSAKDKPWLDDYLLMADMAGRIHVLYTKALRFELDEQEAEDAVLTLARAYYACFRALPKWAQHAATEAEPLAREYRRQMRS